VEDLAGVEIGISEGTVIEYSTDRILEKAGLSPDEIATIAVASIPDRMNLLQSGQLLAANLPDPVASLAIMNGAISIIDDSSLPEVGTSVITFSVTSLEEKYSAVKRFLAAIEKAVDDINEDPTQFNDLLADKGFVPAPLLEGYQLPAYVTASIPSEAQWQDALDWALEKGLIENKPSYTDSVDGSYLP
jgi:NitT/TauT family transport system substrate-binding protein